MRSSVYQKEKIEKRYIGAGRSFKLDVKDRFLMLLVYYRLYITYTLDGFLFDLDQSNICRDIQKIEELVRQCVPIPQKTYNITKRLQTPEEVEQYFPGFLAFIDSTEQQIPRPTDKIEERHTILEKRKDILSRISLWLTIMVISFIKQIIRKDKDMTMIFIKESSYNSKTSSKCS